MPLHSIIKEGAIAEYEKYLVRENANPINVKPREIVAVKVDINPVLDLTSKKSSLVPLSSPFLVGDDPDDLEKCRILADTAREQGYAAIIVPSAALTGEKNLIIYIDGVAGNIQLDDGGKRLPLSKKK